MPRVKKRTADRPTAIPRALEILTLAACAVGFAIGCGGEGAPARAALAARAGVPDAAARSTADGGKTDAGDDHAEPLSLTALAAQGARFAPGMREVLRHETPEETQLRRDVVRAPDHDVCARVAFAASGPVHAWLENAAGLSLADIARAESGILGPRGPVCIRRGDSIVVRTESPALTRVRIVGWAAP